MNALSHRESYQDDLYVREVGSNETLPPLVYLHGLGDSGLCFNEVVTKLESTPELQGRRHLIPDMPGYGRSQLALAPLSLEAMADRLAQWLIQRGETTISLIGHSMGAIVALLLTERHPRLVSTLIDIEGNKTEDDCTFSRLASSPTLGQFLVSGFRDMKARILQEEIPHKGCRGSEDRTYLRYFQSLRACNPESLYLHSKELVSLSIEGGLAQRLANVDCPTAFVFGDPWGSSPRSLEVVGIEDIPMSKIHPAGHWPFIDQPDHCAWAIARAVASIPH